MSCRRQAFLTGRDCPLAGKRPERAELCLQERRRQRGAVPAARQRSHKQVEEGTAGAVVLPGL
jgi:hypothetical protein